MRSKSGSSAAISPPTTKAVPTPASWIETDPNILGGDACIRRTRITVWGLVEWRNLGLSDAEILEHVSGLAQADLDVAWDYYATHREEIDETIRENDEAMEENDEA